MTIGFSNKDSFSGLEKSRKYKDKLILKITLEALENENYLPDAY